MLISDTVIHEQGSFMAKNRPTPQQPRRIRSLFLSDLHMGHTGFDARAAADFIRSHEASFVYLVGDIIDGWKMEKRWFWNDACTDVIDALVDKKKQGAKIFYLPGNHDEAVRFIPPPVRFLFGRTMGIKIDNMIRHPAADGRDYIVIHGDQFDSWVVRRPSKFLDRVYEWLVDNVGLPPKQEKTIEQGRLRPWSLEKTIRVSGRAAKTLLNRFHTAAARKAWHKKADGLIYGHSHVAELARHNSLTLANCGTWTGDKHTAVIEALDGALYLEKWPGTRGLQGQHPTDRARRLSEITCRHPETREIIKAIHDIWRRDRRFTPSRSRGRQRPFTAPARPVPGAAE